MIEKERLRQTPSQTIGPFFAYSLTAKQYGYDFNSIVDHTLLGDSSLSKRIRIVGCVLDGEGKSIKDALLEFCHADENGKYRSVAIEKEDTNFKGFGRVGTGSETDHHFSIITIKPGATGANAPHINVMLFMRGSLRKLCTRIYFPDEANTNDPLLHAVDPTRKHTLIAKKIDDSEYHFDIRMQGISETVFFDI